MLTLLASVVLSVIICGTVFALLLWVKTPTYRLQTAEVIRLLEWVLLGQATENDWRVFCDIPIRHDERLEAVRLQCQQIDEEYFIGDSGASCLLSREGLRQVRQLLDELRAADQN